MFQNKVPRKIFKRRIHWNGGSHDEEFRDLYSSSDVLELLVQWDYDESEMQFRWGEQEIRNNSVEKHLE